MVPRPPRPRAGAQGTPFPRLPALHSAVRVSAWLAALTVGAALVAKAWLAAAVGAVGLAAAGLARLHLRALGRELREALRARAEWERRYYRLHDSATVGVFRAEAGGRLVSANRGLCTLLGYGSEVELIAADFAQQAYVGPGTFEAVLLRARAQGALENLEMRLRRFDGLTVTVLAKVQAIWDDAGEVALFEGTILDLTRERLAESQRRSMERRFRRLFDASAVGMLVGNLRRGTLEEANPALIELFGLRPSELPVPLEKVIPSDQRQLHRGLRVALETHGVAGPLATQYVRGDGARMPVLLSAAMVDPQHGEFVAVLVDRAVEANAVRHAAELLAFHDALLEGAPVPVATCDGDRRLVRCNRALAELLGSRQGVGEADIAGVLGPDGPLLVADAVSRALGGESACVAVELERGGRRHAFELNLLPRQGGGVESAGFVAFITPGAAAAEARPVPADVTSDTCRTAGNCVEGRRTA